MVKALAEASEPGPQSSPDATEPADVKSGIISTTWASTRSTEDLRRLQREDPDIARVLAAKVAGKQPSSREMVICCPATRHYWILWDSLVLQDGSLFRRFLKQDGSGEYLQFLIPSFTRKEVLFQMHDSLVSEHMGFKKTKERSSRDSADTI